MIFSNRSAPILMGLFLTLSFSITLNAEVYRSVDADGNVTYSDQPHSGAEKVEVQQPTIVPSTRSQIKLQPDSDSNKAVPYTTIEIVSPGDEATFRNVQSVSVRGQLAPGLQTSFGHRAQILFNGGALSEPGTSLSGSIDQVDRGAHTLQLVVLDKAGKIIARSPVSQFFLHKTSIRGAN
ncbi:MAG: DUF4124 domain-containing protein [Pseudomonadota bacterium]